MPNDLEEELKRWREKRSQKPAGRWREAAPPPPVNRRTVHINGQEVIVVKRRKAVA